MAQVTLEKAKEYCHKRVWFLCSFYLEKHFGITAERIRVTVKAKKFPESTPVKVIRYLLSGNLYYKDSDGFWCPLYYSLNKWLGKHYKLIPDKPRTLHVKFTELT